MTGNLDEILSRAAQGDNLTREDLVRILTPADDGERALIRQAARQARAAHSGSLVFTYGFVYLSTWCRNDCRFCAYRRTNDQALRYRKNGPEVLEAAQRLAGQGVNLIDLTMGEDPATDNSEYVAEISGLIREVGRSTGLPVMISPGVVSGEALRSFKAAGADWYACYQETHNPELFKKLRQGQSYEDRWQTKLSALDIGLAVEEGALCGVGETAEDLADSILAMKNLGAGQVRAMGFVPPSEAMENDGQWVASPQAGAAQSREIDVIAALRLAMPGRLIPASLDVEGLAGLAARLEAGANVITSLVPADMELAGVAQASLDINNQARSMAGVRPVVESLGLKLASPAEYRDRLDGVRP
ncbi:methylornithine synthase PylB [Deltaproteobacteria bacterium Smac51]|nr:methylornithine synthase PylB [Deltaproteobacteria bacterium Smac51]